VAEVVLLVEERILFEDSAALAAAETALEAQVAPCSNQLLVWQILAAAVVVDIAQPRLVQTGGLG
jgi:hypothetical protein